MGIKVIITGATGMVGEGVLYECLQNPEVTEVLVLTRRPSEYNHPKMKEIIHKDLFDISNIKEQLKGYDACFFCLGTTSLGKSPDEYYNTTYTLTMNMAKVMSEANKGTMVFCYVSGAGTDSTEKGRIRWARVKGKTENDLTKLPFKAVYNFRPGYMHPTPGANKRVNKYAKYVTWLYPIMRVIAPNTVSTLQQVALAMIHVTQQGYSKNILEVKDINRLSGLKG